MKAFDHLESILELIEKRFQMSRRNFAKAAALFSSGLLFSSASSFVLGGCEKKTSWKGTSFTKVLLHNFQLFDGLQNRLQKDRIILIEEGKIQGIESKGDLGQYHDYQVLDLKGSTILPGLIDNHVHITSPFMMSGNVISLIDRQIEYNLRNCVMSGVTTVRDVGGFPGKINKFRSKADKNEIPGPRVISSLSMIAARKGEQPGWPVPSPYLKDPIKKMMGGNFAERPTTLEEIKEVTEEMIKMGAQWLKTLHHDHTFSFYPRQLPNHTDEGYNVILETGKRHNIKCALHAMFVNGFKKGVALGFHTLEHMPMDDVIQERLVEKFIDKGTAIIPTMMVYHDFLMDQKILELLERHGKEYLTPEAVKQVSRLIRELSALEKKTLNGEEQRKLLVDPRYFKEMYPHVVENFYQLNKMGAKIGVGTDCGGTPRGWFGRYSDELKTITSTGISNFDTLRMATAVNAGILDMQEKIGTIEKGKHADLIAVEGNPLKDIEVMDSVAMVMKGGVFVKAKGIFGSST